MADKPILFSAPMVRALLDGTKTQTRRVIKNAPGDGWHMDRVGPTGFQWTCEGGMPRMSYRPPVAVGDRLYVRERFRPHGLGTPISECRDLDDIMFHADADEAEGAVLDWKPSIHMPRWASRLTLTITDVRVQKLHAISEGDAVAEGMGWAAFKAGEAKGNCPISSFRILWNAINGPGAWDANPWVCAYTFTVQRGNIDQLGAAA
ncbi:hypothetical protein QCN27_03765 [Cereibacter sp. SYSU M97828]|nr:hypothetical protein [Cereibacter flavus]